MKIYILLIIGLLFSCQSKQEKFTEQANKLSANRADSLLAYSETITSNFLKNTNLNDCVENKKRFKVIQKTYNQIATLYREEAILLNIPEDTIRYRLGMANKVLQDKEMATCVGLEKGYTQFSSFKNSLKH